MGAALGRNQPRAQESVTPMRCRSSEAADRELDVTAAACIVPTWRALRLNPVTTLQQQ